MALARKPTPPTQAPDPVVLAALSSAAAVKKKPGRPPGKKPAVAKATAKGRKSRSVWRIFADQVTRARDEFARIERTVTACLEADSTPAFDATDLESIDGGLPTGESLDEVVGHLVNLDKAGVVPPRLGRPSAFEVGQAVRVTKAAMPKYLASGLYDANALAALSVQRLGRRECLCVSNGHTVHILSFAHLEAR